MLTFLLTSSSDGPCTCFDPPKILFILKLIQTVVLVLIKRKKNQNKKIGEML